MLHPDYPKGGVDFYLMDHCVAEEFSKVDIPNASIQMSLLWVGFPRTVIHYKRKKREKGKSGYSFLGKVKIAFGFFTSESAILVKIWGVIGIFMFIASIIGFVTSTIMWMHTEDNGCLVGSIISSVFMCSSIIIGAICSLNEYIWRMYELAKERPRE